MEYWNNGSSKPYAGGNPPRWIWNFKQSFPVENPHVSSISTFQYSEDVEHPISNLLHHFFEINDSGLCVQIPHDLIGPFVLHHPPHLAPLVQEISKGKNTGGTRLQAGGLDLAITDLPLLVLGHAVGLFDPLNTE